jgi:hypothetical protein
MNMRLSDERSRASERGKGGPSRKTFYEFGLLCLLTTDVAPLPPAQSIYAPFVIPRFYDYAPLQCSNSLNANEVEFFLINSLYTLLFFSLIIKS